jgi:transposase-like protein
VQYLNNILEQDHRAIKCRVKAKQGFRAFDAARRTIASHYHSYDYGPGYSPFQENGPFSGVFP